MTLKTTWLTTSTGITVFHNGEHVVIGNDHPKFSEIKDALKAKKYDEALTLSSVKKVVEAFVNKDAEKAFSIKGQSIFLGDYKFSDTVSKKALAMIDAGNEPEPLFAFLRKVLKNPSSSARQELLLFCEANKFMINENGNILAYKSVRNDYKDIYSGTVDYSVGKVVEMERAEVDDNRYRTCSYGLHFAAYEYATTWPGRSDWRLLLIEIDPADVVAIPADYKNQKARTSKLTVVAELPNAFRLPPKEVYTAKDVDAASRGEVYESADDEVDEDIEDFDTIVWQNGFDAGYTDGASGAASALNPTTMSKSEYDGYIAGYNEGLDTLKI